MTDPPLRLRYEEAVVALRARVAAMRDNGVSSETIARTVHAERRWLTATFKELTPEPWRSRIHNRTFAVYGDSPSNPIRRIPSHRVSTQPRWIPALQV
jgi:hypothetical protein